MARQASFPDLSGAQDPNPPTLTQQSHNETHSLPHIPPPMGNINHHIRTPIPQYTQHPSSPHIYYNGMAAYIHTESPVLPPKATPMSPSVSIRLPSGMTCRDSGSPRNIQPARHRGASTSGNCKNVGESQSGPQLPPESTPPVASNPGGNKRSTGAKAARGAIASQKGYDVGRQDKPPSASWLEPRDNPLVVQMLDKLEDDEHLRRILFAHTGDKPSGKTKTYAYARLAKHLFSKNRLYAHWYKLKPSHWGEVVRTKLMKMTLKYKEIYEANTKTGAGLTDQDYAEGSSNLVDKNTKDFAQYKQFHRLMGDRGDVGIATVNSQDPPDFSALRLGAQQRPIAEIMGNLAKGVPMTNSPESIASAKDRSPIKEGGATPTGDKEADSGSEYEVDQLGESTPTEGSESDDSVASEQKRTVASKRLKTQHPDESHGAANVTTRMNSIGSALEEAAKISSLRKSERDNKMYLLQKEAHALTARRLDIQERQTSAQEATAKIMAEVALQNARLAAQNAENDHAWKMRMAEIEADKLKLALLEASKNSK